MKLAVEHSTCCLGRLQETAQLLEGGGVGGREALLQNDYRVCYEGWKVSTERRVVWDANYSGAHDMLLQPFC